MAGVAGWSKNGIGKSLRSRRRASTPLRLFRCCKIHFAGFSEKRPSRVLPTMTEMMVIFDSLHLAERKTLAMSSTDRLSAQRAVASRPLAKPDGCEPGGLFWLAAIDGDRFSEHTDVNCCEASARRSQCARFRRRASRLTEP